MINKDEEFNLFCEHLLNEMDDLRKLRGLTKTDVARNTGRKIGYLVGFFNGKATPTLRTIYEIANSLDCDVEVKLVPRSS